MSKPKNILFICSDQHSREVVGCYGNEYVNTPNLDRLAERGTVFENAYCNFPICVPSRASMVTGEYASKNGFWDNGHAYCGEAPSFGARLDEQGYRVTTFGKLHFKDNVPETGFKDQRLAMNVHEKKGDLQGCIRDDRLRRNVRVHTIQSAGKGETDYTRFDRKVSASVADFLKNEAKKDGKPWFLYAGFVTPHFPLTAPEKFYDRYYNDPNLPMPYQYGMKERPMHPVIEYFRRCNCLDCEFDQETLRRAVAAYYGLVSFMDEQCGVVLDALREAGLEDDTIVIYGADHGDTVGNHGLFFKHTLYEGSVGIPMILSGGDIPRGKVCKTPVSLIDIFPTVIDGMGAVPNADDQNLPGKSLIEIAGSSDEIDRIVFAEYHAVGSNTAEYMIRKGAYKMNYYVGYQPQLFNLEEDPRELNDLAENLKYKEILDELERELRKIVDPEETDRRARIAQKTTIEENGGESAFVGKPKKYEYSPIPDELK